MKLEHAIAMERMRGREKFTREANETFDCADHKQEAIYALSKLRASVHWMVGRLHGQH